ncbi:MAG: hypothetical protein Fues2KO_10590 [Fuerstiella sp.]
MRHPLDEFKTYLATRGRRLTQEREIVARAVFTLRPPFTAEAVLKAIRLLHAESRVSRATVFRTLKSLCDGDLISARTDSGEVLYDHPFRS